MIFKSAAVNPLHLFLYTEKRGLRRKAQVPQLQNRTNQIAYQPNSEG